jgi:hypothetical protein
LQVFHSPHSRHSAVPKSAHNIPPVSRAVPACYLHGVISAVANVHRAYGIFETALRASPGRVGSDQGGRARSIIHQTELSGLNIRGETQHRAQTAGHELEPVIAAAAAEQKTRAPRLILYLVSAWWRSCWDSRHHLISLLITVVDTSGVMRWREEGSSQWTLRWREPDSNPRSLLPEERGRRSMALDRAPMPRSTRSPVTSTTSGIGQRIEPVDLGVRERFPSLSQFAERAACACDRRCENLTRNLAEKPDQGILP